MVLPFRDGQDGGSGGATDLTDWANAPAPSTGAVGYIAKMLADAGSGQWYHENPLSEGSAPGAFDETARFKGAGTSEPVDQGWEEYGNTNNITATGGVVAMDMTGVASAGTNGNAIRHGDNPADASHAWFVFTQIRGSIAGSASYSYGMDLVISTTKMLRLWVPTSKSTWHVNVASPVDTGISATTAADLELVWRKSDNRLIIFKDGDPLPAFDGTAVLHTVSRTNLAYMWQNLSSGSTTGQLLFENVLGAAVES